MRPPALPVWPGCELGISKAVMQLQKRWRPSSTVAHTICLVEELIDPAIEAYALILPARNLRYLPGATKSCPVSNLIRSSGFLALARAQRMLFRIFVKTKSGHSAEDQELVATLETLVDVFFAFSRKIVTKTMVRDTRLSSNRCKEFCRLCGYPTEFNSFFNGDNEVEIYIESKGTSARQKTLRLSDTYCVKHRPKSHDGQWNQEYRRAQRSIDRFDVELKRMIVQNASLQFGEAKSGDPFVDFYLLHYVLAHNFDPTDEGELRHHARRMVDNRLSDRKKKIVIMHLYGASQSDIARELGIERQAVFKDLSTIPNFYHQLPKLFPAKNHSFGSADARWKPAHWLPCP